MALDWSKHVEANTCAVDWSELASASYSDVAKINTKLVAKQMVIFVKALIPNGLQVSKIRVAGHGVAVHIAGIFGKSFRGEIDAIFCE